MISDGMKLAALLSPVLLMLAGCPQTSLPDSVDVKLQESGDQRLIIHNQLTAPVRLLRHDPTQTVDLRPSESVDIHFRVLSVRSYARRSGEPYYSPTPLAPTNHFEEIDNLGLVDTATPAPQIHYRDPDGREHVISIDLDNCDPASRGKGWEAAHWGSRDHDTQIPPRIAGVPQAVCPNP